MSDTNTPADCVREALKLPKTHRTSYAPSKPKLPDYGPVEVRGKKDIRVGVAKILLKENNTELISKGYIDLDAALVKSTNPTLIAYRKEMPETPFYGRRLYTAELVVTDVVNQANEHEIAPKFLKAAVVFAGKTQTDSTTRDSCLVELNIYSNMEFWESALKFLNFYPEDIRTEIVKVVKADLMVKNKDKLPDAKSLEDFCNKEVPKEALKFLKTEAFTKQFGVKVAEYIKTQENHSRQVFMNFPNQYSSQLKQIAATFPHEDDGYISDDYLIVALIGGPIDPYVSKAGKEGINLEVEEMGFFTPPAKK